MSVRWLLPAGLATALVGASLVVPAVAASAGADLPDRTAEQLLSDLQGAEITAVQGTVEVDADLGLPSLPGMAAGGGPHDPGLGVTSMLSGTTTLRVWASQDGARVAALGDMGETDVITDGAQVWIWTSADTTVTHLVPPTEEELAQAREDWLAEHPDAATDHAEHPDAIDAAAKADERAMLADLTPDEISRMVLEALDPSTEVTTGPSTRVAGRPAYQLVLTPTDPGTLVSSVTIAIDAAERVPTRVTIGSTATGAAALTVGWTSVSFTAPDPSVFTFTPPATATVETPDLLAEQPAGTDATGTGPGTVPAGAEPQVIGEGWARVLVLPATGGGDLGALLAPDGAAQAEDPAAAENLSALLAAMPEISGDWGSGRLLSTHLLSVLVTDDGRMLVGAVDRATLEAAASATR